jgi:hypothetical protein
MSSFSQKRELQGLIKKCITPEPLEKDNEFFKIESLKVWPIFCAISDIFLMFHTYAYYNFSKLIIKKMSKTSFF